MCRFTTLTYACGHTILLTTARHTLLCTTALVINMKQGIDAPPASCFPLPTDITNRAKICAQNQEFAPCPQCTSYNATDTQPPTALEDQIAEYTSIAVAAITLFHSRPDLTANAACTSHPFLHATLAGTHPEALSTLLLYDLREARELLGRSGRHSDDGWDAARHLAAARRKISLFCHILEALEGLDAADGGAARHRLVRLGNRLERAVCGGFGGGELDARGADAGAANGAASSAAAGDVERGPRNPRAVDADLGLRSELFAVPGDAGGSFGGLTVRVYPRSGEEELPIGVHCVVPDA
ncbi:hypothetical protein K505DRAFT_359813 [Melanomma pulvis-pyrius CBS 109.77]|uniref:Uncharacterized protein n=1 Tax=Melanomma pulvis-pyrius CBS 109.77 TaxID=1314802 RepID=A0A6A6XH89_9PLEO|nr:hypothetical protein K505DRAFT_359813 [Melanomma pulvis-pyrius CBS 109.77]